MLLFFAHKKLKKTPSKVAQKYSNLFSPCVAQTAKTEEFMFQNVAYIPTVYKTGTHGNKMVGPKIVKMSLGATEKRKYPKCNTIYFANLPNCPHYQGYPGVYSPWL